MDVDAPEEGRGGDVGLVPAYVEQINPARENKIVVLWGPPIMIKFTVKGLSGPGFKEKQVYTTLELRMGCGIGKCGRCNVGARFVCRDGPVFSLSELQEPRLKYQFYFLKSIRAVLDEDANLFSKICGRSSSPVGSYSSILPASPRRLSLGSTGRLASSWIPVCRATSSPWGSPKEKIFSPHFGQRT